MSEAELAAALDRIAGLDLAGLRSEWGRRYGVPPPLRSVALLALTLAWRNQADARGGIGGETRRALARKGRARAEGLELGIGARLTRQWQGHTHEVLVEPGGFCWEGRHYRSLSAVATAIAGSRWNGPRFFGLRDAR